MFIQETTAPLTSAVSLIEKSVAIAREGAGQMAQEGHDDQSVLLEQAATTLDNAILLIVEGARILAEYTKPELTDDEKRMQEDIRTAS